MLNEGFPDTKQLTRSEVEFINKLEEHIKKGLLSLKK